MRLLRWIGGVVLAVILLGFGFKNTDSVSVHYFLGWEWHPPLVAVLFAFFFAGAVLGVLAGAASRYRQRRELTRLRRELRQRHTTHEPVPDLAREHRLQ